MSDSWGPPAEPAPPGRGSSPAGPNDPDPYGQGSYGQRPYGQSPYGQGPYGSAPVPTPASDGRPRGGGRSWQAMVRGELAVVLVLLAAGLVLGGVWALAGPGLADAADPGETRVAVDGLLALLQIGAGLVTAVLLVLIPGREPVARLVAVLVGATVAGLLTVPVGAARGLHLQAPGAALLWPLVAAVLTALRMLVGLLLTPEGDGGLARRRRA